MIELDQLSVTLPGFRLRDVSLCVAAGEFFVLLGPTGSGKTVILESIAGLVPVRKGLIRIEGQEVTHLPPENRRIGMVYQDNSLFPHLTVMDNICYGLRYLKQGLRQARQRVSHLVDLLGLQSIVKRRPLNLSGGEKQRVCLARALSTKPSVLLLDEPLSALDPNFREEIRNLLKKLHHELGITFLMVTHDFSEALTLADRIGVIQKGTMEQIGLPEEIFRHPANPFVAEFVGMKNFFPGCVSGDVFVFSGMSCPLAEPGLSKKRLLALRPEDIHLSRYDSFEPGYVQYRGFIEQILPAGLWYEIRVRCGEAAFRTVLDRKTLLIQQYREGDGVYLGFDTGAARLF